MIVYSAVSWNLKIKSLPQVMAFYFWLCSQHQNLVFSFSFPRRVFSPPSSPVSGYRHFLVDNACFRLSVEKTDIRPQVCLVDQPSWGRATELTHCQGRGNLLSYQADYYSSQGGQDIWSHFLRKLHFPSSELLEKIFKWFSIYPHVTYTLSKSNYTGDTQSSYLRFFSFFVTIGSLKIFSLKYSWFTMWCVFFFLLSFLSYWGEVPNWDSNPGFP